MDTVSKPPANATIKYLMVVLLSETVPGCSGGVVLVVLLASQHTVEEYGNCLHA